MAKGIDINGTLRGKRGGIVYYRANGEQLSRPRVTPRNPKSAKQAVQRMVLATAAKIAAAYRPIIDHSNEGMQPGSAQVNKFRARTMQMLRQAAAVYFDSSIQTSIPADFALKGAPTIGYVSGLQVSRGSLPFNDTLVGPDDELNIKLSAGDSFHMLTHSNDSQSEYEESLAAIGLAPGDQLTIIMHGRDISQPVAQFPYGDNAIEANFAQFVSFARVTFAASIPDAEGIPILIESGDGYKFNPQIIVDSQGTFPLILSADFAGVKYMVLRTGLDDNFLAAAAIRSQKQENGSFKYSSALMQTSDNYLDSNNAYPVYLSYMADSVPVQVGDTLYLQNAVAQPN